MSGPPLCRCTIHLCHRTIMTLSAESLVKHSKIKALLSTQSAYLYSPLFLFVCLSCLYTSLSVFVCLSVSTLSCFCLFFALVFVSLFPCLPVSVLSVFVSIAQFLSACCLSSSIWKTQHFIQWQTWLFSLPGKQYIFQVFPNGVPIVFCLLCTLLYFIKTNLGIDLPLLFMLKELWKLD